MLSKRCGIFQAHGHWSFAMDDNSGSPAERWSVGISWFSMKAIGIPADGVPLACTHLSVDESILTGESVPVRKAVWDG